MGFGHYLNYHCQNICICFTLGGLFIYFLKSTDQPNQSSCLIPHRNELVPPLHDTCGTCGQISFRNENFDPVRIPGQSRSGTTRSGVSF